MSEERETGRPQPERRPPGITEADSAASDGGSRADSSPASLTLAERRTRARTSATAIASPRARQQPVEVGTENAARGQHGPMDLRIDELVLEGFSPGDHYRISEAIEGELSRLLTEGGVPASLSSDVDLMNIDGGAIQIGADTRPAAIGIRLARSIYRSLTR